MWLNNLRRHEALEIKAHHEQCSLNVEADIEAAEREGYQSMHEYDSTNKVLGCFAAGVAILASVILLVGYVLAQQ